MSRAEGLDALGMQIERLVLAPEAISAPLTRLFRPILHRVGWRPTTLLVAFGDLVAQANRDGRGALRPALDLAIEELQDSVRQIEHATIINRRVLTSYAAWARRVYEALVGVHRALESMSPAPRRYTADYLPPMTLQAAGAIETAVEEEEEANEDAGASNGPDDVDPARLLELQLDSIDELMAAARAEDELLARRRRLLEAARQALLETSAVLKLDPGAVEQRLEHIAGQVTRLNRLQGLGLREDVGLLHQARTALSRGERNKLFAALSVLNESALDSGRAAAWELSGAAISSLAGAQLGDGVVHSLERSVAEVLGADVVAAVDSGYAQVREQGVQPSGDRFVDRVMAEVMAEYLVPGAERATLSSALMVDGCFDVGGAMSPVRVQEEYVRASLVRHPTADLALVQARGPDDLQSAIIQDPRMVMLDLAAGRLLSRRFVRQEVATRDRTVMQGEVRIYLMDGSGSMRGARARMRDAILVAELATLSRRLSDAHRTTRVVVYYRYFNQELGPVFRVDSAAQALQAIHEVMATIRTGGTDIQEALLSSLRQVRDEEQADPDLRRAQIVLVTDGEAPVDQKVIARARGAIEGVPVGVSVIALGVENPALRHMVAQQRRQGDRAFYHYLSDAYLERLCSQSVDGGPPVHLPPVPGDGDSWRTEALGAELEHLLDELVALSRSDRDKASEDWGARTDPSGDPTDAVVAGDADGPALLGEGARARRDLDNDNTRALVSRFSRWFPEPTSEAWAGESAGPLLPEEGTLERHDLESAFVLLATITEVIETIASNALARKADALEMLERLLPHSRLTPGRYHELLRLYPQALNAPLEMVHSAARAGLWGRMDRAPAPL